jgi:hypothetical protein
MSSVFGNLRYGARMLVRRPGLSLSAVVALALGIGLTTTMFSIVYVAVLKGLPFEDADELVALFRNGRRKASSSWASASRLQGLAAAADSFDDIAAYYAETVNVGGTEGNRLLPRGMPAPPVRRPAVRPILGRTFRPEEDHPSTPPGRDPQLSRAGSVPGDPAIVGRTVRANAGHDHRRVMPESSVPSRWTPGCPAHRPDGFCAARPTLGDTGPAIGRLKDGVTFEQAQAEVQHRGTPGC